MRVIKTSKLIITCVLFLTININRVSCFELNLNESLIEDLFSELIQNNNSMVLSLRKNAGYSTANEILAIEEFIIQLQQYTDSEFNDALIERGYSSEIGIKDNFRTLTINDWILIERLMLANEVSRLMGIADLFADSNNLLQPVKVERTKNADLLKSYNLSLHNEYYLSTQFKFVQWIVNNEINKSIGNVDLIENGNIVYIWKKLKNINVKIPQELFDELYKEDYLEHYILASLRDNEEQIGLIETKNLVSKENLSKPCALYLNIENILELVKSHSMTEKWLECDCKGEYISFYMLKVLVDVYQNINGIVLDDLESIKCMDNLFDLYLNAAQISKFNEIDNAIKSIYFSINFNNLENQGEFMIEYFDKYAKNGHVYSDLISKSIKEILSYSK